MIHTLKDADVEAVANRVAQLVVNAPLVVSLKEAMRRTDLNSKSSFHEWAGRNRLRSLQFARGRYAMDSVKAAIERASRRH